MAKKKSDHIVSDVAEDPKPVSESTAEPERVQLTSEQLRALFTAWSETHAVLKAAEDEVEKAKDVRSVAVKAIVDAVGNKGPWTVDGVRYSVVVRGERYNMQREGDSKLTL